MSRKKRGPGQPPHVPTQKLRDRVSRLAAVGVCSYETIASYVGISVPTLEKHYRAELDHALTSRFEKSVEILDDVLAGAEAISLSERKALAQWFLARRAKWTERTEVTGKDGDPLLPSLDKLTDAQLSQLAEARRVLAQIAPEASGGEGDREARPNGRA